MHTQATLLPDAAAKLAQATALLASIGLTPREAGLLAVAADMSEELLAQRADWSDYSLADLLSDWSNDAECAWTDHLADATVYLADAE